MAKVVIKRKKQFAWMVIVAAIHINDRFVGTIKVGKDEEYEIEEPIREIKVVFASNSVKIKTNIENEAEINISINAWNGRIRVASDCKYSLEYSNDLFNTYEDTNKKLIHSAFLKSFFIIFLLVFLIVTASVAIISALVSLDILQRESGSTLGGVIGGLSSLIVIMVFNGFVRGKLYISDQSVIHRSFSFSARITLSDIISIRISKTRIEIRGSKTVIVYANCKKVRDALNNMMKEHKLIIFVAAVNEIESKKSGIII